MKTSLKKQENDNATIEDEFPPVADSEALAELGETDVSAVSASSLFSVGSVVGSISQRDLNYPTLSLIQNVGPLSAKFKGGDLVFNKTTKLAAVEESISLIVLSIVKTYEDRIPYDPNGPKPTVYKSIEDVLAAGKWADWRNDKQPPVREVATALVLIAKPEDVEDISFCRDYDDQQYALAMWTMRNTNYTRAAKKIFTEFSTSLSKTGLESGLWDLSTERTQINGNYVFAPVLRLEGRVSPDTVAMIRNDLG